MDVTCRQYDAISAWFDSQRSHNDYLMERYYLEELRKGLHAQAHVLDLGCGTGEPIAGWLIRQGYKVTGVDGAPAMITLCQQRFPAMHWINCRMQEIDQPAPFDAIIAWDSMFHLSQEDQRGMFPLFGQYCKPGGLLLFTSGPHEGNITGEMQGMDFSYSSLSPHEYRSLLEMHDFQVLIHNTEDPECGNHTVWLSEKRSN